MIHEPGVLFLDDEENILNTLQRQLLGEPFEIYVANSVEQAQHILNTQEIAVVVSDQRMPGVVGSEFLAWVRYTHPETTRMIMSGYSDVNDIIEAINLGAIHKFIVKPWSEEKLIAALHEGVALSEERRAIQLIDQSKMRR